MANPNKFVFAHLAYRKGSFSCSFSLQISLLILLLKKGFQGAYLIARQAFGIRAVFYSASVFSVTVIACNLQVCRLTPYPFIFFSHTYYPSLSQFFVVPYFGIRELPIFAKDYVKAQPKNAEPYYKNRNKYKNSSIHVC